MSVMHDWKNKCQRDSQLYGFPLPAVVVVPAGMKRRFGILKINAFIYQWSLSPSHYSQRW